MTTIVKSKSRNAVELTIAFIPWLLSMYTIYWLEYGEVWTTATPHRDKITIAILASGMGLSFLLKSFFDKREKK